MSGRKLMDPTTYIPMFWKNLLPTSSEQMDIASLSLISTTNCVSVLHLSSLFQRASKIYIYGSRGCICVPSTSTRPQYFYMNISFFQTYPVLLSFMYVTGCTLVPFTVRSSRFVWWHLKKCLNSIKLKKKNGQWEYGSYLPWWLMVFNKLLQMKLSD